MVLRTVQEASASATAASTSFNGASVLTNTFVFFEICELGTFVDFYRFCAERWRDEGMMEDHYVLKSVKALRNAAAHNSCIVNGFVSSAKRAGFPSSRPLTDALNAAGMKNSRNRRAKLRNISASGFEEQRSKSRNSVLP